MVDTIFMINIIEVNKFTVKYIVECDRTISLIIFYFL